MFTHRSTAAQDAGLPKEAAAAQQKKKDEPPHLPQRPNRMNAINQRHQLRPTLNAEKVTHKNLSTRQSGIQNLFPQFPVPLIIVSKDSTAIKGNE
jgi:hypothetical protein